MDLMTVNRESGVEFSLRVRGHDVRSDMSKAEGGQDGGPAPVELLAGSLGACIGMMVQTYCTNHGYDGDVGVSLTLELADDPKRIGAIVVDLEIPESVPEDRREAIRRVAERCPIHATLSNPPNIDIDIV
jgi:putative redox protein